MPPAEIVAALQAGLVIPAHPLALDQRRKFDERSQRALTRYYLDSGSGGVAVGVHSTQFEIREAKYGLFQPVLELAVETITLWEREHERPIVRIAGICGRTAQAMQEARLARELGYHSGLLSLAAFQGAPIGAMLAHAAEVAQEIALFGFYLQPAVGGVELPYAFWRAFLEIPNVVGIKVAPFNRYQTLEVMRALADSGRSQQVALYTGNDDHIVMDLLTRQPVQVGDQPVMIEFKGGLLGHWACWTSKAVVYHAGCRTAVCQPTIPTGLLTLAAQVTDCNAAFFDAAHQYAGSLAGINEVLRRQGLMQSNLCLDELQCLSPGQMEEIERVYCAYPNLNDDDFVRQNLERWRS